jgi:hypothetical protein
LRAIAAVGRKAIRNIIQMRIYLLNTCIFPPVFFVIRI